jgi:hypothetical protein
MTKKSKITLLGLLALIAAFGLILTGCPDSNGGGGSTGADSNLKITGLPTGEWQVLAYEGAFSDLEDAFGGDPTPHFGAIAAGSTAVVWAEYEGATPPPNGAGYTVVIGQENGEEVGNLHYKESVTLPATLAYSTFTAAEG